MIVVHGPLAWGRDQGRQTNIVCCKKYFVPHVLCSLPLVRSSDLSGRAGAGSVATAANRKTGTQILGQPLGDATQKPRVKNHQPKCHFVPYLKNNQEATKCNMERISKFSKYFFFFGLGWRGGKVTMAAVGPQSCRE